MSSDHLRNYWILGVSRIVWTTALLMVLLFLVIERIMEYPAYILASIALMFTFVLFPVVVQIVFGKFSCWSIVWKILVIGGCSFVRLTLLYDMCMPLAGQFDPHTQDEKKDRKDIFVTPDATFG